LTEKEFQMKKRTLSLLVAATLTAATAAEAAPTYLLSMETADIAQDVSVGIDFNVATNGLAPTMRAGAFGGEVLLNSKSVIYAGNSGFNFTHVGYKMGIGGGLAGYGFFSYSDTETGGGPAAVTVKNTDFAFGVAYTLRQGEGLVLNANAEIVTDDGGFNGRGDKNTLFVKLGGGYSLPPTASGRFTLMGMLELENSDVPAIDTVLNLGLRWEPRKNVTVDFIVFTDRGDGGSNSGIPGAARLNLSF
jgi:hypothetical protein